MRKEDLVAVIMTGQKRKKGPSLEEQKKNAFQSLKDVVEQISKATEDLEKRCKND